MSKKLKKNNYINKFLIGDWIKVLKTLPSNTYHCCVTSPPYWGQRDYGTAKWKGGSKNCDHIANPKATKKFGNPEFNKNRPSREDTKTANYYQDVCPKCGATRIDEQLGLEKTPEEHIIKLVEGFREVRRILRPDGVCWINYGDKYSDGSRKSNSSKQSGFNTKSHVPQKRAGNNCDSGQGNLLGLAWRLAFALQADGWILRSDVIWAKGTSFCDDYAGSCMPESVNGWRWERHKVKVKEAKVKGGDFHLNEKVEHRRDCFSPDGHAEWIDCPGCEKCNKNEGYVLRKGSWRSTRGHEYVFQLTKSVNYFCDMEAVKQEYKYDGRQDTTLKPSGKYSDRNKHNTPTNAQSVHSRESERWPDTGKNLRDVWLINPRGYSDAHYATFPEELIEPMIKVSTSEKGVCPKCGSQWARIVRINSNYMQYIKAGGAEDLEDKPDGVSRRQRKGHPANLPVKYSTIGWKPTCDCGIEETIPALVIDPFSGSGTVSIVADKLKRNYTGIDLNPTYVKEHAERRMTERKTGVTVKQQKQGFKGLFG